MDWRRFLWDRLSYILFFTIASALVLVVVGLDLAQTGAALNNSNLLYIGLLLLVALVGFLLLDWHLRCPFYKGLERVQQGQDLLETFAHASPRFHDEELTTATLRELYARYTQVLEQLREQQELHNNFLIRWVHQMKTPLSVLDLLLQEQDLDVSLVLSMREELDKLVQGLDLALSDARLKQFNLDFSVEHVDLATVLREVINQHKKAFIRAHVYPRLKAPPVCLVHTDKKWIAFVFSQLVVNALKYSRLNDGKTREVVVSVDIEQGQTLVCVTDAGVGIVPEDLCRVFEPFFTGQNGRRFPESTGMGLYLSQVVCQHLGHELSVASVAGQGSTFTVTFKHPKDLHRVLDDRNVS